MVDSRSPARPRASASKGHAPPQGGACPGVASQALRHAGIDRLRQNLSEGDRHRTRYLQAAIGSAVRERRQALDMTVSDLARRSGRSIGTLSKIENGISAPSVDTLGAIARALDVPVAALFTESAEQSEATFVPAGRGISRRGLRSWDRPQHRLVGLVPERRCTTGLYLITLKRPADLPPLIRHAGFASLHMLEGEVRYRHGDKLYRLGPGDTLSFNTDLLHGPVVLVRLPVRFLSAICNPGDA